MSGGSFNYLYCKDSAELFNYVSDIEDIEEALIKLIIFNDLQNIRIMGYTAADLLIVAERLRAGGVDIMKIKNYTDGFIDGYERANEDFKKAMKKCVDNIISGDLVDKEQNQGL